jgi:hypothetical protein
MSAKIVKRGDDVFVASTERQYFNPVEYTVLWRVTRVARSPYRPGFPADGDVLQDVGSSCGVANYHGDGYSVHFPSTQKACESSERPIPPPKVRAGIEVRYTSGRWEKLLRKGWVAAE